MCLIIKKFILLLTFSICCSCAYNQSIPLFHVAGSNELPMYGGVEFTPQQIKANEELIKSVSERAGSREKASDIAARIGWSHYYKSDYSTAMKRFNQAWLLNHNNPLAYWGFAVLLSAQGKHDEAYKMFEKALSLDPNNPQLIGDVANLYVENVKTMDKTSPDRQVLLGKAESLLNRAEKESPDYCIYGQSAVLNYYVGNFQVCLDKAKMAQKYPRRKECDFVLQYEQKCNEALK